MANTGEVGDTGPFPYAFLGFGGVQTTAADDQKVIGHTRVGAVNMFFLLFAFSLRFFLTLYEALDHSQVRDATHTNTAFQRCRYLHRYRGSTFGSTTYLGSTGADSEAGDC